MYAILLSCKNLLFLHIPSKLLGWRSDIDHVIFKEQKTENGFKRTILDVD